MRNNSQLNSIEKLVIKGAREHNLKNLDISIPKNKLVVITGLSGSGKSSLAFDTIYAEGQRRYVESLSAYARQFLGLMEKPDVDSIEGLSPAISIDQKSVSHNPRSTVGTITEIYDYMRLLFARIGHPHCPNCGTEITTQTVQQIVDAIVSLEEVKETRVYLLAPIIQGRKGTYEEVFEGLRKKAVARVRVDGKNFELDEQIKLDRYKLHTIDAVIDRLVLPTDKQRLTESVETALKMGDGLIKVIKEVGNKEDELIFSEKFSCPKCGNSIGEIEPRSFSFNSPYGACVTCSGLGSTLEIDPEVIINPNLSLDEGAILPWNRTSSSDSWTSQLVKALSEEYGFSTKVAFKDLEDEDKKKIMYGADAKLQVRFKSRFGGSRVYNAYFEGVVNMLKKRYAETESDFIKQEIEKYMFSQICPTCHGNRLKPASLAITINNKSISEVSKYSIQKAFEWFENLKLDEKETLIGRQVFKEIIQRLKFLLDVGLNYLTIDRTAYTLAGGEAQRIRLASQIGSGLSGVLYILDEPSIGLHQRDNTKLIDTLINLKNLGNTVIVVEHDDQMIKTADFVIDIGPGAGQSGGKLVAVGSVADIEKSPDSITGKYLSGRKIVGESYLKQHTREKKGEIVVKGAREHNLKNIDVTIPLGQFVCVTGVSGSGKSTLVNDILYRSLAHKIYGSRPRAGKHQEMLGVDQIDKVIDIDQSPIGRTPRSNPATYTGVFGYIRELFSKTTDARMRGYGPGRFSFNVKGGRCENCEGDGVIKIEMQFLPDVFVTCEVCHGRRYNREALEIEYKGRNIADVLEMTVSEALEFFENIPFIKNKLQVLNDVGLGYIRLGQSATTLSGGEAQRVKLATELSKRATGKSFYILDEPTTGLHFADIENLLLVLHRLVDSGNTVLVIEHNLDVIKTADFIVDLGPEGGDKGGNIVATGTPRELAKIKESYTGQFLKALV